MEMIVTTGNEIQGRPVAQYLGIASGIVVRSASIPQAIAGGLGKFIGGNVETYAKLCAQARQDAFARMVSDASQQKADAILAFRYDATEFSPGVTEVLAYGTAVKLTKVD